MNTATAEKIIASRDAIAEAEDVLRADERAKGAERVKNDAAAKRAKEAAACRAVLVAVEASLKAFDKARESAGDSYPRALGSASRIQPPTIHAAIAALEHARGELNDRVRTLEAKQI